MSQKTISSKNLKKKNSGRNIRVVVVPEDIDFEKQILIWDWQILNFGKHFAVGNQWLLKNGKIRDFLPVLGGTLPREILDLVLQPVNGYKHLTEYDPPKKHKYDLFWIFMYMYTVQSTPSH